MIRCFGILMAFFLMLEPINHSYGEVVYKDNFKTFEFFSPLNPEGKWAPVTPHTTTQEPATLKVNKVKRGIELSSDFGYLAIDTPAPNFGQPEFQLYNQHLLRLLHKGIDVNGRLVPFRVGEDEYIEVTLILSVQVEGVEDNIFNVDPKSDKGIVLGMGGFLFGNTDENGLPPPFSAQTICIFMDNNHIYAFQDTFFRKTNTIIATREPDEVHTVKVRYDRQKKIMKWKVDGELVAKHKNFGLRPEGINKFTGKPWLTTSELIFEQDGGDDEYWAVVPALINMALDWNIADNSGNLGFVDIQGKENYRTPTDFKVSAEEAKQDRENILLTPNGKEIKVQLYKLKVKIGKSNAVEEDEE